LMVVIAVVFQWLTLVVILLAIKHHRSRWFTLLVVAQLIILIDTVVTGIPYLITLKFPALLVMTKIGFGLFFVGSVLGLWGLYLLISAYTNLAKQVSGVPSASA
jgi:uncharacterized membrane protein YesL